jgi:hypothetical protein
MSVGRELLHELPQQPVQLVRPAKDRRRKIALIGELCNLTRHGDGRIETIHSANKHVISYWILRH